jgi:hypothetical protein
MMRLAVGALAIFIGMGTQDSSQIAGLVQKLNSDDWVEQAQAAKELSKIGRPALEALAGVMRTESESGRYWASIVSQSIMRNSGTAAAPAEAEPISNVPNPKGFAPGANDMGSLVFVCNNPGHGAYEATFSRCTACSKTKRFAYDYGSDCYRCAMCKKAYARNDIRCDKCGRPPAGRIPIRMKSQGGL